LIRGCLRGFCYIFSFVLFCDNWLGCCRWNIYFCNNWSFRFLCLRLSFMQHLIQSLLL